MASYWPGLRAAAMLRPMQARPNGDAQSWVPDHGSDLAATMRTGPRAIRHRRGVDNGLHPVRDDPMGEDDGPIRDADGASNFAALRLVALALPPRDQSVRRGTPGAQKEAGWDHDRLLRLRSRQG